jgi:hypothetical protein
VPGGPDAGVEPVAGVVGKGDGLVVVLHLVDTHHRPERFLPRHEHFLGEAGVVGGFVEVRADVVPRASARDEPGTLREGVLQVEI